MKISTAWKLGRTAYKNSAMRCPAMDSELMNGLDKGNRYEISEHNTYLLKAWLGAWDHANLKDSND